MLEKIKRSYILWHEYHNILPKTQRYSLGNRIDRIFIELIEAISTASFLAREEKLPYVRLAIRKLDTLKVLVMVLWETKSIDNKKYIALSVPIEEMGRMLGGWSGQLTKILQQVQDKQNSPTR